MMFVLIKAVLRGERKVMNHKDKGRNYSLLGE